MAYTSKNPRFNSQTLTDQAGVFVSNPPSGADKLVNRNGQLYLRSSSGTETPIGAGAGGINYLSKISDGTASVGTVSTVAAGGNVSVTGSFPNVTSAWYADATSGASAIGSSTDSSLRGTTNYLTVLSGASTSGATFVQTPVFNIDGEDLGKAISIKFDLSGVTTDDDWDVVVVRYDSSGTFQELIPVAGNVSTVSSTPSAKLPLSKTSFRGFFITGSTASDTYAVRWRRRNGTDQIRLDTLVVGPEAVMEGAIVTDWEDYVPTVTGQGTISLSYAQYRRVGSNIQVRARWTAGTVDGTTLTVSLPSVNVSTSADGLGVGGMVTSYSGAAQGGIFPLLSSSNTGSIYWTHNNSRSGLTALAGNAITINSAVVTCSFECPISEWQSNTQMAARAVEEYAYNYSTSTTSDTTSFGYGPDGFAIKAFAPVGQANVAKRVRFQTPILPTDILTVEFYDGTIWRTLGNTIFGFSTNDAGSTYYGVQIVGVNNTDVDVRFYSGAGPGVLWSAVTSSKWRVRKVSGGAAVGYPVSARNVIGDTSGTAVPAGYVGEQLAETWSGLTIGTTDTTLATHSSVNPGIYLFIVETDCVKGSSTRITSGFSGTATYSVTYASLGGDYNLFVGGGAGIYATYYVKVTSAGTVTFFSRATSATATSSRGSFSIVRIA